MFSKATTVALLASAVSAEVSKGFNYGSTFTTGAAKQEADFAAEFKGAQGLVGAPGFTSARLYTMIQAGTANTPISAIPAAISTKTTLLLGLWGSAGQAGIESEIAALRAAISQYGTAFTDLVVGISVGSEDLYRITPTGIANKAGIGAQPFEIASYINQVRGNFSSQIKAPIGHVDTWTAWVNGSNSAVVDAADFLGVDGYPYFQTVNSNGIENGASLFFESYQATVNSAKGKPVWITETGWPVSGPVQNLAVASVENAKKYWDDVACKVLGVTNTWWYTLQDAEPDTPSPSFGLVGAGALGNSPQPLYDLTCSGSTGSSSSSAVVSSGTSTAVGSATGGSSASSVAPTSSIPAKDADVEYVTVTSTNWNTVYATGDACTPGTTVVPGTVVVPTTTKVPANTTPVTTGTPGSAPTSSVPTSSACPANLNGEYQYPHLIVSVDKSQPNKAPGTSYFGYVNSTVSTIYDFDIPQSYAGKTCTLVFLFPQKKDLETTDYTLKGTGGLTFDALSAPATEQTTYANAPKSSGQVGSIASLTPGNSYTITSGACPAGQRIAYEISATGSLDLSYFEDWNPSPLGLFIRTC